jgi:outer membrane protein
MVGTAAWSLSFSSFVSLHCYMPAFMRFFPVALFVLCAVNAMAAEPLTANPDGASPLVLSLDDALERVRQQNPLLLFNREGVVQALEQTFRDRSRFFPQVSLRTSQDRRRSSRSFGGGAAQTFYANSFDLKLDGSVALINAQNYASFRLAEIAYQIRQRDYQSVMEDFLEQTAALYFQQLRDQARIRLIESTIERDQQLLKLTRDQLEAGVATVIDVTRAEVRIAREERALIQQSANARASMERLKVLLDVPSSTPLELTEQLLSLQEGNAALGADKGAQRAALLQRPELLAATLALEQAQLARRAASWQRLPSLEVFGNVGYETARAFDSDMERGWLVGVRASVPLFEGFRIAAEKRQADAAVRANTYRLRDLENSLVRDYQIALSEVDSRFRQIPVAEKEVSLATEELRLARERFTQGVADNRELIDAQQALALAEDGLLEARFFYGLSRVAFARVVGAVRAESIR